MKNIVQVKAKHIEEAKRLRRHPSSDYRLIRCCPVALATQEHTGKVTAVNSDSIRLYAENSEFGCLERAGKFQTTRSVQRAISAFDNNRPLKPFNFRLTEIK